jgi:ribonuclease J
MQVCIHRGTQQIGGTCIEIEQDGQRIVLDVGSPLDVADPDALVLPAVAGFAEADESLLGVVISHPHQDHYGLAHRLPAETVFLIGEAAENILAAADIFTPAGATFDKVMHPKDRQPIVLGPFTITPFLVDHSAYDAYAVLVEAGGKRLFYSGDLRAHGRKAKLFERLVHNPPEHVDVLLMEGTTISRPDTEQGFPTEADLEAEFVRIFADTEGMPLVWCSGQNIDRIVSIFRACKRSGRRLIIDMYTAHVLRATGNEHVPQADWDGIDVFLPQSQRYRIIKDQRFDVSRIYQEHRIYPESLPGAARSSVMLFRPSMMRDLESASCLDGASLICSVWPGYLERDTATPLMDWLRRHGMPLYLCHTSGHASTPDLLRFRNAFPGAVAVPVHLEDRGRFAELFDNVVLYDDGQWWTVA